MRRGFYSASPLKNPKPAVAPQPLPKPEQPRVAESPKSTWRSRYTRHEKPILFLSGAAMAAALVVTPAAIDRAAEAVDEHVDEGTDGREQEHRSDRELDDVPDIAERQGKRHGAILT